MAVPPVNWSSEELKSLLNQALALEFVKLRQQQQAEKAWWRVLLESNLVPTLITVCLGTILGGVLADHIQATSKSNDEARAAQAAAIADERKTVEEAFTIVAKTVAAAQSVIDISGKDWNENAPGLSKGQRQTIALEKRNVWKSYNSAIADWRVQRERLGLLLTVKQSSPKMRDIWERLTRDVNEFTKCSVVFNRQNEAADDKPSDVQSACDNQRGALRDSLKDLTRITVMAKTETPKG